jgi:hypothetical protein
MIILTAEQEALIPVYREKWRAIALSTERIDRQAVAAAVGAAYEADGLEVPQILSFASPKAAWKRLGNKLKNQIGNPIYLSFKEQLFYELQRQLDYQMLNRLYTQTDKLMWQQMGIRQFYGLLTAQVYKRRNKSYYRRICPEVTACQSSLFDFCASTLGCIYDELIWQAHQSITIHCGWTFPFERACLVCDRPTKILFDEERRLHGEPAIEFTSGFCVYAHHGELITEQHKT